MTTEILIETDIAFDGYEAVLNHLADKLIAQGFVKASYRAAIFEREANFPTGIELEYYAVAIPHCEAEHALKPAIYFIRPNAKVTFNRADDDSTIDVDMIIALVVTDPAQQLQVLRKLFGQLQDNQFIEQLLAVEENQLTALIYQHLHFNE